MLEDGCGMSSWGKSASRERESRRSRPLEGTNSLWGRIWKKPPTSSTSKVKYMRDCMRRKPTIFSKKIHEIVISVGTSKDDIRVGSLHDWNRSQKRGLEVTEK